MKIPVSFLAVLFSAAAATAEDLKYIGAQPDYVLTVLDLPALTGSTVGSNMIQAPGILYGGYTFVPAKRDWAPIVTSLGTRIRNQVAADGWKLDSVVEDQPISIPSKISILAKKGNQYLEIMVWLFPVQDAKVGVSYTLGVSKNS